MTNPTIVRIEQGIFEATRPRSAGSNARLGEHGPTVRLPIVRVTASDGTSGFGISRASREQLTSLLGTEIEAQFDSTRGIPLAQIPIEFPLVDLIAKRQSLPVYQLLSENSAPLRVPTYDTSLYFDDLHLDSDEEAVELLRSEAKQGYDRGHRNFKIKVGRGGRHMPLEAGTKRDIAIIRAVREVAGPKGKIMIDANNGYNLNLTKQVLTETADCNLYWLEEAFHEDVVLYRDLKEWLAKEELPILIADGEGEASPSLLDWAKQGIVDVVQYDIINPGLTRWLVLGKLLDEMGAKSAPHHYGTMYGNYATCHLAPVIQGFQLAEWDEASTPGLDGSAYTIADGFVTVPNIPGFGLELDDAAFLTAISNTGFVIA